MVKSMDEHAQIIEVIDRLTRSYPALTSDVIADVVHNLHATFDGAPLREFVPLFVERKAHSALDQLAVSYA
jgi:hypothetical protein